jgi:hypothetical protein
MLKSAANPDGLPINVFDNLRSGIAGDRSQFYKDLAIYSAKRPGAKVSQGTSRRRIRIRSTPTSCVPESLTLRPLTTSAKTAAVVEVETEWAKKAIEASGP